jgi:SAM-dependent methyltransferase
MQKRPHFVEEYEGKVDELLRFHPLDHAMEQAVGGHFEQVGNMEVDILVAANITNEMTILDLGCGSGRAAIPLALRFPNINYIGIDIVQRMLDYAASKCPPHFRFICHQSVDIPLADHSVDVVAAFSLFTHLLHEETFCYLQEIRRILKPGGLLVLSYLEYSRPDHWPVFEDTVNARKSKADHQLNIFFEESVLRLWAIKLGLFVSAVDRTHPIGQTLAYLRTRRAWALRREFERAARKTRKAATA